MMKRLLAATLNAFFILAAAGSGRAQTASPTVRPPSPPGPSRASPSVDQGRLEGGTYSNDFFNFSFAVPQGWVAQDAAAKKAIMDEGRAIMTDGADARKKAQTDAAMARTVFLLSVSKYDLSAPPPDFNALLLCIAERVPTAVIKSEADYLRMSLRSLQGTRAQVEMAGPVRAERIGGVTFAAADVKTTTPGTTVAEQKYYTAFRKGYALVMIYTYVDEGDVKAFEEILKSVRFR